MKSIFLSFAIAFGQQAYAYEPVVSLEDVTEGLQYDVQQPPVSDPNQFKGMRIGIMASHGVQESELAFPYEFLRARGATVKVLAPGWVEGRVMMSRYVRPTHWVQAPILFELILKMRGLTIGTSQR